MAFVEGIEMIIIVENAHLISVMKSFGTFSIANGAKNQ